MGNELDVCSKDEQLVEMFERNHGPANETTWQFFQRNYTTFCDKLISPNRYDYSDVDIYPYVSTSGPSCKWDVNLFSMTSLGKTLQCCHWKTNSEPSSSSTASSSSAASSSSFGKKICIVYLHNNLRSLADAMEVFPLANVLCADVLAMDLAGSGKSEGTLHGQMDVDIENLLCKIPQLIDGEVDVIIWARGMSTALLINLLARVNPDSFRYYNNSATLRNIAACIKCVVLDSPFTSVEDMVSTAITRMHGIGYVLARPLLYIMIRHVIHKLSNKLQGLDLYQIKPISHVSVLRVPCIILSADSDDYIPVAHGEEMSKAWGGNIFFRTFSGTQFSRRTLDVVLDTFDFIQCFLTPADSQKYYK